MLSGCATFDVHRNSTKIHGIPFYVKDAGCKHQSVYIEPYYILTLTTTSGDKILETQSGTLSQNEFTSVPVVELRTLLSGKSTLSDQDVAKLRLLWTNNVNGKFYDPYRAEASIEPGNKFLAANTLTPELYVNYTDQYSYNANRPAIGSVQASIKLGDDGTLSEASAQAEDKTLSTILGLFPISDLIKTAVSGPTPTANLSGEKITIELKTERKGIKFTRTSFDLTIKPPCKAPENFGEVTAPYALVIEDVNSEKLPKDGNNISVAGTISLPKSDKNAKPEKSK